MEISKRLRGELMICLGKEELNEISSEIQNNEFDVESILKFEIRDYLKYKFEQSNGNYNYKHICQYRKSRQDMMDLLWCLFFRPGGYPNTYLRESIAVLHVLSGLDCEKCFDYLKRCNIIYKIDSKNFFHHIGKYEVMINLFIQIENEIKKPLIDFEYFADTIESDIASNLEIPYFEEKDVSSNLKIAYLSIFFVLYDSNYEKVPTNFEEMLLKKENLQHLINFIHRSESGYKFFDQYNKETGDLATKVQKNFHLIKDPICRYMLARCLNKYIQFTEEQINNINDGLKEISKNKSELAVISFSQNNLTQSQPIPPTSLLKSRDNVK